MTATDVLRRMLDERGVEHYDGTERTLWGYEQTGEDTGIYRFAASEISGGFLQVDMFRITPEQAIAATLGNRTDLSKRLREVYGLHAFAELFGFDWTDGSDWDWHDVACAMADAVDAATVRTETCHEIEDEDTGFIVCSECGAVHDESYTAYYCWCCGRRIEQ